jgi:hypothetical protein
MTNPTETSIEAAGDDLIAELMQLILTKWDAARGAEGHPVRKWAELAARALLARLEAAERRASPAGPAGDELVSLAREWREWAFKWSGTAFLADEKLPPDSMLEVEHKAELYSDLCKLGNAMYYLEDALHDRASPCIVPAERAEPVVWRWRTVLGNEDWVYIYTRPTWLENDSFTVEPLYPQPEARNSRADVEALDETQIKHMVDRFLMWRLPESFNPDGGISFEREYNQHTPFPAVHEPVGTNLFDAQQATAMVRHMIEGLPVTDDFQDGWDAHELHLAMHHRNVDEIVTQIYRRFKEWSQRGFGPDDVTWCEVKADILALITAHSWPDATGDGLQQNLDKLIAAVSAAGFSVDPVPDGGGAWHYVLTAHDAASRKTGDRS